MIILGINWEQNSSASLMIDALIINNYILIKKKT